MQGPMEYTLSLTIWELRFEIFVSNSFLLNLFPMYWRIGDIGSQENLRIEIWVPTSIWLRQKFEIYGPMKIMLPIIIWELSS